MKRTSKFIIPSLVFGSALFADQECPPPKPVCPPKPACPSKCSQMSHERGPMREITPNAGPCVSDGADFFVTADFIYWVAREDHLDFAITTGQVFQNASSKSTQGDVAHPKWKFEPGFKVGAGLDYDHDGWDSFIQYTWFRSRNNKRTIHPKTGTNLLDNIIGVNAKFVGGISDSNGSVNNATLSSAKGKWELENFNVIDLELGRNFYISRYLMLRPYVGMKGSWQKQEFDATFKGTENITVAGSSVTSATTRTSFNHQKFWGIGLLGGLDTSWHFTRTFSMFGNLGITTMWEFFKASRKDNDLTSAGNTSLFNLKSQFHAVQPVIETQLGLRYEEWFYDDNYHFSVEAGWELQWWHDMNQFYQTAIGTHLGDLMLQGLTVHLRFDF